MKTSVPTLLTALAAVASANPFPPDIPTKSNATASLETLVVAPSGSDKGYSSLLFPHWILTSGLCNTRATVLKRDGFNTVRDDITCTVISGDWNSPYDGVALTKASASAVDIDHLVPLYNAWISGASDWTLAKRTAFANDLSRPELWAVSHDVNVAKGDQSPDQWKPPLASFQCTYAESWIQVKSFYALSVTSAEKQALEDMLATCN